MVSENGDPKKAETSDVSMLPFNHGRHGQFWRGRARQGLVWPGVAGVARLGAVRCVRHGVARSGMAGMASLGCAWFVQARRGMAGKVGSGQFRRVKAWQARRVKACFGMVWLGGFRHGTAGTEGQ